MKLLLNAFLLLSSLAAAQAAELTIGKFSSGDLSGWHEQTFRGKAKTTYQLASDSGRLALKARSRSAASGLLTKTDLDLRKYPILRWSWKVEQTLKKEDVTKKTGDDFAARVYVVFPRNFFWQTRAINYVWAARLPKNSDVPDPYTANAMIIAVESGQEKVGTWVTEERNFYEDYKRLFKEEPHRLGAVAIMTDTDDTGDEATAWFGDIFLADR